MAAEQNATLLAHTRVTAIDTQAQRIRTDSGELEYSKLVLASAPTRFRMACPATGRRMC